MSRLSWWLIEVAAGLLDRPEREAVLGDIAESEGRSWRALTDVLGLVVRRQIELWHNGRRWLALLGVAGTAGTALSWIVFSLNASLWLQIRTWRHFGVRYETGRSIEEDLVFLACLFLVMCLCSWGSGMALVSLSGRAVWATGAVFYLVVAGACPTFFIFSGSLAWHGPRELLELFEPVYIGLIGCVIPAIWGARQARRAEPQRAVMALSAVVTFTGAAMGASRIRDAAVILVLFAAASSPLVWLCSRGRLRSPGKGERI